MQRTQPDKKLHLEHKFASLVVPKVDAVQEGDWLRPDLPVLWRYADLEERNYC